MQAKQYLKMLMCCKIVILIPAYIHIYIYSLHWEGEFILLYAVKQCVVGVEVLHVV